MRVQAAYDACVLGIMGGCYALYMAAYMGTSITVASDQIVVTHWFRSTATISLMDVSRVISLCAYRWDQADLDRLWHFARVTPEGSWEDAVTYQDLKKRFPGAF